MTIRPLQDSDITPLREIYNHYVRTSTCTFETSELTDAQMLRRLQQSHLCLTLEDGGRVMGYCALHPWRPRFDRVAEATMYLAPQAVSRGFGSLMLERIIAEGRRLPHLTGIIACINATNRPSRALVEKFGFRQAGEYFNVARKHGLDLTDVDYHLIF